MPKVTILCRNVDCNLADFGNLLLNCFYVFAEFRKFS